MLHSVGRRPGTSSAIGRKAPDSRFLREYRPERPIQNRCAAPAGNALRNFAIVKTGVRVAKVVQTFGCVVNTAETLDEFRDKNASQIFVGR